LRFLSRALRRSSASAVLVVGATALACGLVGPAAAQQIINGPLKVTDSGPGVSPSGYAIKGISSFSNDSALFGYGTGALSIDGVTGYVDSPQSVGIVGWADTTATAGYGVYGYSGVGNGVYGQSNSSSLASIYGVNNATGGTAMYGYSAGNGVVGVTDTPTLNSQAGVLGVDASTDPHGSNYGVVGLSNNPVSGTGVYGVASNSGGTGVYGSGLNGLVGQATYGYSGTGVEGTGGTIGVLGNAGSPAGGIGVYANGNSIGGAALVAVGYETVAGMFQSADLDAVDAVEGTTGSSASLAVATGEAGAFYGNSGSAQHPALVAQQTAVGTDYFAAINASPTLSTSEETFAIQASTANFSGYAVPNYGSDVQVSGDLYVQGAVYQLCSSNSGAFPVTSPQGHCYASVYPAARTKTSAGVEIGTYPTEQSAPTMEDFGEAQLVNGQANVPLERTFASTIDRSRSYLVFVTPEGDCNGLYVTGKSASGFVVRELKGGRSTVAFQYRIVAHPYANNAARLPVIAAAAAPGRTSLSSHIVGPRMFKSLKLPRLPRDLAVGTGRAQHAPNLGSLPKRLPPPTMSASFKR